MRREMSNASQESKFIAARFRMGVEIVVGVGVEVAEEEEEEEAAAEVRVISAAEKERTW